MSPNVKTVTQKLPTYLGVFLQPQSNIRLIFEENQDKNVEFLEKSITQVSLDVSELELTGTPLETDLGGNVSVDVASEFVKPNHWSLLEAHQYPISLIDARVYLNEHLRSTKDSGSTFSLCDGKDDKKVVLLGSFRSSSKISTITVYILPCCKENDLQTSLEFMEKEHLKNVRGKALIKTESLKLFDIYGYDLRNCSIGTLKDAPHNGHISLQVLTTSEIDEFHTSYAINLQVVMGSPSSQVFDFWEELFLLESFIKLLGCGRNLQETTVINKQECLNYNEINSTIKNLIENANTFSMPPSRDENLTKERELTILDKLWNTLKKCETLSTLREYLHFFFEELAETQRKVYMFNDDKSAVADIVSGILNGKVAVPTLSFSQSLELLIELGLQKLKNDYITIFNGTHSLLKETALKIWGEINSYDVLASAKTLQRRTRISISTKSAITDLTMSKLKLSFLVTMHKVTEFIYLYKDNIPKLKHCFDAYCDELTNEFLVKFKKIPISHDLKAPKLCQFSSKISFNDGNHFIKNHNPVAQSIKLVSTVPYAEVETVFHFSDYPIFPPSIFENYDFSLEDTEKCMYVAKLVKYTQIC